MITLTDAGIVPQTSSEILAEMVAAFAEAADAPDLTEVERSNLERLLTPIAAREAQLQAAVASLLWAPDTETASGASLAVLAGLAGTRALPAVASTIPVRVVGAPTTDASGRGIVDPDGTLWVLPADTIIPGAGYLDVTATAAIAGPTPTPSVGSWSTSGPAAGITGVSALDAAQVGAAAETAAELRQRLRARRAGGTGTLGGVYAAVAKIPGIGRHTIHERRAPTPDPFTGNPAFSLELVAEDGAPATIAETLLRASSAVAGLVGLESEAVVLSEDGRTRYVGYTRAAPMRCFAAITLYRAGAPTPLPTAWASTVRAALAAWASDLALAAPATAAPAEAAVAAVLPPLSYSAITVRFAATSVGPFTAIYLAPGPRALISLVNAPGPAVLLAAVSQPYTIGVGWNLVVSVDGGGPQIYTFGVGFVNSSASAIAAVLAFTGAVVDSYLGSLRITSATVGTSSSLEIMVGSTPALLGVLGWSVGTSSTGTDTDINVSVVI